MKQPIVDNKFETFDINIFNKLKKKYNTNKSNKVVEHKDQVELQNRKEFKILPFKEIYSEFDINGLPLKEIIFDGEVITREYFTPYLAVEKYFGSNKKLKLKGIKSWLGFSIGYRYSFDQHGLLYSQTNTDEGYDFGYEAILKFLDQKGIKFTSKAF